MPRSAAARVPAEHDDPATGHDVTGRRNHDRTRPTSWSAAGRSTTTRAASSRSTSRSSPPAGTSRRRVEAELGQRVVDVLRRRGAGSCARSVPTVPRSESVHGIPATLDDPRPIHADAVGGLHLRRQRQRRPHPPVRSRRRTSTTGTPRRARCSTRSAGRSSTTARTGAPRSRRRRSRCRRSRSCDTHGATTSAATSSRVIDALGSASPARTSTTSPAGRCASTASTPGCDRSIFDAAGGEIERRDSKGALTCGAYDRLGRLDRLWARDDAAGAVTLRERIEYGDGGDPDQPRPQRGRGRVAPTGSAPSIATSTRPGSSSSIATTSRATRWSKRAPGHRRRRLLGIFPAGGEAAPDWDVAPFRVDWEPPRAERSTNLLLSCSTGRSTRRRVATTPSAASTSVRTPTGADGRRRELPPRLRPVGRAGAGRARRRASRRAHRLRRQGPAHARRLGNGRDDPLRLRPPHLRAWSGCDRSASSHPDAADVPPAGRRSRTSPTSTTWPATSPSIVDRTPGSGVRANPDAADRRRRLAGRPRRRRRAGPPVRLRPALPADLGHRPRVQRRTAPRAVGRRPRCGFDSGSHGTPNQDNAPSLTALYRQAYHYDPVGNLLRLAHDRRAAAQRASLRYRHRAPTALADADSVGETRLNYATTAPATSSRRRRRATSSGTTPTG